MLTTGVKEEEEEEWGTTVWEKPAIIDKIVRKRAMKIDPFRLSGYRLVKDHSCLHNKAPKYLADCCVAVSDIAGRQRLRSAQEAIPIRNATLKKATICIDN